MPRWFAGCLGLLALAVPSPAQLPPEQALASLQVAEGLQVELFAAEPMVLNPTSLDIDHHGRVWLTEAVNYRRKMFRKPLNRPEGDRIVVLCDTNADGKADEAKTFYQGEDLYGPLSVCVIPQADGKALRVLVAQSPDILEFWDRDGDLQADGPPTKFLSGFGGVDHDHGVHGLSVGPDGKLYFTVGDGGVRGLQAKNGKGPRFTSNSTDCRAGTVWRCDLDGNNLERIAHNFRNNYEACVNSFGEIWCSDNDDDGNQQTRICFVMPGGNYGYHPRGKGQSHWHEEQPGIVHKALRTGFGSPTGICFYEGNLLPEKYRGQLLHTDAGPRELRCFHITPKGAGYELEKENLLTSSDNWFRLSDVCVAPDGSVFVCDWYDPGVGGHGMGDWTRGRVYRITPKGHKGYTVPAVNLDTADGLLNAFRSPNLASRVAAVNMICHMGRLSGKNFVEEVMSENDISIVARAYSVIPYFENWKSWSHANREALKDHQPERIKAAAIRLANNFESRFPERESPTLLKTEKLSDLVAIANPAVSRELLLSLKSIDPTVSKNYFYPLAKLYDGKDHFYRAALNIALGTDPARRDAILADFDKQFPEWNDTVADLVWELRPKSVLPRLEKLLTDAQLTGSQKARIVDILASSDNPDAGKTLLKILTSDAPKEVKAGALANLRLFLPTKWNALTQGEDIPFAVTRLLGDAQLRVTGLQLVAAAHFTAAIADIEKLAADEKQPQELRLEAVRTLGKLRHTRAVDALMRIGQPENPLSVPVVQALGEQLPAGGKPSEAERRALDALQLAITLPKGKPELKQAALAALAGSRSGTDWLLSLREKDELPAALVADTGRLLRNSPFQGQRNKALLLFPAPGKLDPKKLPPISELAKRSGNADRGRAILAKSAKNEVQCLKCHTIRGQGGQIGPDLSMIGKKGSKENLLESLLVPSKAIADQYISQKVDTVDGQTLVGLVVGETDQTLTLRDANGKDYIIPVADIDARSKSPVSLMPDNLVSALTEEEFLDVIAYLQTLQTPSLTPDSWYAVGPFPAANMEAALRQKFGPEQTPFQRDAAFSLAGRTLRWSPLRASGNGYFDLAARNGNSATNSATYLYRAIESPVNQEATFLLGTDDGGTLWVNDQEVWSTTASRAAAPDQDRVTVKLRKGSNSVLLKVANGNSPHGFYLTITSGQELKAQ
ncbi:MAG: c-type cytochrome [Bacteroidales bacterium]|nr:c-type cytochrome [Bacteroidales bacterium]